MASLKVIEDEKLAENAQKMGELTRKNLLGMNSPLVTVWGGANACFNT